MDGSTHHGPSTSKCKAMEELSGVRKGAWSKFEDELLKACVHVYGEGQWHLVPQRAGLKRCRKSCRLRWLNYLKPNIKRGDFSEDEVDLMIKLHKLLGNRWSLIAGRLPGRTSNDVKNYWNTYTRRKSHSQNKHNNVKQHDETESTLKSHEVVKPVPLALSKTCPKLLQEKFMNSSKVGLFEEGTSSLSGSENRFETFLDEKGKNITVNNKTCFFAEKDGVFEQWDEELSSIASHFLTECETWTDMFLDLGIN